MGRERESHTWSDDDLIDGSSIPIAPSESDPWNPVGYHTESSQSSPDNSAIDAFGAEEVTASQWNPEDLRDHEFTDQWEDIAFDGGGWEEPDPTANPISELSESLYPPDNSIMDISKELKIGELLASVSPCTRMQHARCHELLSACSIGRLRRLIPWLRNYSWCGDKLQLFLEFRDLWGSPGNTHWWEFFYWDHLEQEWMPQYLETMLTLEHALELVKNRAGRIVTEVIEGSWFDDWGNYAAWEHGIRSFASFAVFRAGISDDVRWWEYLERDDQRTPLEIAQCMDTGFAPFMLPSIVQQYSCPRVIDVDPWPDVTDMAHRRATALGGNLAQAWEEILGGITGYRHGPGD